MLDVDVADDHPPHVAGAALGTVPMEGDRLRSHGDKGRPVADRRGRDDGAAGVGRQRVVTEDPGDEVEPDELGDVRRPGMGGDLGERTLLG